MHPAALRLVMVMVVATSAATVCGHQPAAGTPAARFWDEALPGSPMPKAIADLVQEGIDRSLLVMEHASPSNMPSDKFLHTDDDASSSRKLLRKYDESSLSKLLCSPTSLSKQLLVWRCDTSPSVSSSSSKHCLPQGLFFHQAELRVGMTIKIFFPQAAVSPFLPRDIAEKAPLYNLTDVLATFNVAPDSADAAALDGTLRECEAPPMEGDQKACSVSLEGTVKSAMAILGATGQVWATASAIPRTGLPVQQYVVEEVSPLDGDRHVGCHDMQFPYAVYMCHMLEGPSKAYKVSLRGLDGGPTVAMVANCHLDTSKWNPAHKVFEILDTKPGGAPVCHFMPYANLVFGERVAKA